MRVWGLPETRVCVCVRVCVRLFACLSVAIFAQDAEFTGATEGGLPAAEMDEGMPEY